MYVLYITHVTYVHVCMYQSAVPPLFYTWHLFSATGTNVLRPGVLQMGWLFMQDCIIFFS